MKWNKLAMAVLLAAGLCAQAFGQKNTLDPVMDFGFKPAVGGKSSDRTGQATFFFGKSVQMVKSPSFGQGVRFDGSPDSVSKITLSPDAAKRLDGFDFTMSFWFRVDKPLKLGTFQYQPLAGDTGLGVRFTENLNWHLTEQVAGAVGLSYTSTQPLEAGRWYNLIYWRSVKRNAGAIYLDGVPVLVREMTRLPLDPLILNFSRIGNFAGAIADLRVWDRVVPVEELLDIAPDSASLKDVQARLSELKRLPAGFAKVRDNLAADVSTMARRKSVSLPDHKALSDRITSFFRMSDSARKAMKTGLKDSPFLLLEVPAVSPVIRTPDVIGPDAVVTGDLRVAAAKDEFEPVSFLVVPYEKINKFELIPGDFQGENGASIPASAIDRKAVKCWYQASWNSYMNNTNQVLLPDLLLNDDSLVKVDETSRTNYLRIEYPAGSKYCDVNFFAPFSEAKSFNWGTEPVRDASSFQPLALEPLRAKQFWFTVHVPKDAKPGLYHSTVRTLANGKPAGEFTISLRVYPFELPKRMRTHYDLNEEFLAILGGGVNLATLLDATHDAALAERILRRNLQNELDHGFLYSSGGSTVSGGGEFRRELFLKDMKIRRELGFPLDALYQHGGAVNGWMYNADNKEPRTKESVQKYLKDFKKYVDAEMSAVQEALGHTNVYFYGIDECDDPFTLATQSMFVDYIQEKGGNLISTGKKMQFETVPGHTKIHSYPGTVPRDLAQQYHAIHAKLLCYAGPFAGPDNPHLMRYSQGLRNYFGDCDGFNLLWYSGALHMWNERCAGPYRNLSCVYLTHDRPVNSLGFEGTREAIDDVKYATLLRQTAEECFASKDPKVRQAAAKAVAWFELSVPDISSNLDLFRAQMAEQIIYLMKQLGREVK